MPDDFKIDDNEQVNLGNVENVPDELGNGDWPGFITYADYIPFDSGNKRAIKIGYKVHMPGESYHGETAEDFLWTNDNDPNWRKRLLRDRKAALDIPSQGTAGEMREFLRNLKGTPVWFSTQKRGTYVNVTDVKKRDDSISGAVSDPVSTLSKPAEATPDY